MRPISARFTPTSRMVICDGTRSFCTMLAGPARGFLSEVVTESERPSRLRSKGVGVRKIQTKRRMGCVCPTLRDSEVNRLRQKFWPVIVAFVDFIQQRILRPANGVQLPLDLRAYFDANAYRNQPHLTDSDFSSTWIASDPLTKQSRVRYSPTPYRTSS